MTIHSIWVSAQQPHITTVNTQKKALWLLAGLASAVSHLGMVKLINNDELGEGAWKDRGAQ